MEYTVTVSVVHVLVGDHDIVLACHVVGNVVVHDEPQESVKECQVDLLVGLLKFRLQQHH